MTMTPHDIGCTIGQAFPSMLACFLVGVFAGNLLAEYLHGDDEGEG
jgi:cation transporter-like permease